MGRLTCVRHGQASFLSDDYDRLSALGARQCALLGDYWGRRGRAFQHVYTGTLRRHYESYAAFAEAYRQHGHTLPEPQALPEFDEHQGFLFVQTMLPLLAERDPLVQELFRPDEKLDGRTYLRLFRHLMIQWSEGTLNHPEFDSWADFRRRVERGVAQIRPAAAGDDNVLLISSGGTIGAIIGYALDLSGRHTMQMNFTVRNTGYADFMVRDDLFILTEFNALPHLDDEALHTFV